MNTRLFSLLSFVCVFAVLASCSNQITEPADIIEVPKEVTFAEKKLSKSSQSFSFNLFQKVVAEEDEKENVFISPLSVSMALGMTINGAKKETYRQMRETLALQGLEMEEINEGYKLLAERLKTADKKVKLQIANSVWSKKGFTVEDDFSQRLEKYFDAEATELDFTDPESVNTINKWVAENTNGLIDEIIDGIPHGMVMYLINAVYFKGDWTHPFNEKQTHERSFFLENNEKVIVEFMSQERAYNTYFSEEVNMIDATYGDSLYSMTLMMPTDHNLPLNDFITNSLTKQNFDNWISKLTYGEVQFSLPKFEMEYDVTMNNVLKSMGMEDAFSEIEADFTGINKGGKLSISEVKHKAFITVDEKGTEAGAATSVGVGITSMPPSFTANRPFVFLIREQKTGAIIFMGKVGNPALTN
ncbi:MAG: serpin family protein [Balneolaceae bacterium]